MFVDKRAGKKTVWSADNASVAVSLEGLGQDDLKSYRGLILINAP